MASFQQQLSFLAAWRVILTVTLFSFQLREHGQAQALPVTQPEYPWPSAKGPMSPGSYSVSKHPAPRGWEKKQAWFFPGARGNFSTTFIGGIAIDDEGNLYTASADCIYKLDKNGRIVWIFPSLISSAPAIHNGILYTSSKDGRIIGIDMVRGISIFETKVCEALGTAFGTMGVSGDVAITSTHASAYGGDTRVTAVNASTGKRLWQYTPNGFLWSFQPIFTGEGSFVFQDQVGGVYHLSIATGKVLWKAGHKGSSPEETWTDAAPMIGPNRMVYALQSTCRAQSCSQPHPGSITAYRLDDGARAWTQATPYSPNSQPAVAKLGKSGGLSVILPLGQPAGAPPSLRIVGWPLHPLVKHIILKASVWLGDHQRHIWGNIPRPSLLQAYDAETGEKQWSWEPPVLGTGNLEGDEGHFFERWASGNLYRTLCAPGLWASPTVDAKGTIFVGHGNGRLYSLRDVNEDGIMDPATEVQSFDAKVAFGPSGLALGPGMAVIATCEGVLAFKE